MAKLQAAGEHLLGVIDSVLELSKIEAGKIELNPPFDPAEVLRRVGALIQPRREQGLQLILESCPLREDLSGDATRIQQCLLNFAGNALKFTESGSITLTLSCPEEDRETALFAFRGPGYGNRYSADALPDSSMPSNRRRRRRTAVMAEPPGVGDQQEIRAADGRKRRRAEPERCRKSILVHRSVAGCSARRATGFRNARTRNAACKRNSPVAGYFGGGRSGQSGDRLRHARRTQSGGGLRASDGAKPW